MWNYGYPMAHDYMWHPIISFVWAIVVLVIVLAVLRYHRRGHGHWRHHCRGGALETLRERYAKGEIGTAEYEERKKALEAE